MSETEPNNTDQSEWEFDDDDVIREIHEPYAPSGVPLGKSEYKIRHRLIRESDGEKCYLVETNGDADLHLYTATTIEGQFEIIDPTESHVDAWMIGADGTKSE